MAGLNAFVGLEAAGVAAYSALTESAPASAGQMSQLGGVSVSPVPHPSAGPQPAPVAIAIPSIKVATDLVSLDVDPTGALDVPDDYSKAGWWAAGPSPGADGAAVVVGHLDSRRGPAVFFRVPSLKAGDGIDVRRADGSTVSFVVDAVRQYPKNSLPARRIYGPTPAPELRLITCGGKFDRRTRSYEDNIVVFAHKAGTRPGGEA